MVKNWTPRYFPSGRIGKRLKLVVSQTINYLWESLNEYSSEAPIGMRVFHKIWGLATMLCNQGANLPIMILMFHTQTHTFHVNEHTCGLPIMILMILNFKYETHEHAHLYTHVMNKLACYESTLVHTPDEHTFQLWSSEDLNVTRLGTLERIQGFFPSVTGAPYVKKTRDWDTWGAKAIIQLCFSEVLFKNLPLGNIYHRDKLNRTIWIETKES